MDLTSLIIGLVVGLAGGVASILIYYNLGFSKKKTEIEAENVKAKKKAATLLANAEKNGESRKRELLLQAKEEIHKAKQELERDSRSRQSSLDKERNRIEQKESEVENREKKLDSRDENLSRLEKEVEDQLAKANELVESHNAELEKVASLSMEEAREQLLTTAEQIYRRDLAARYVQLEAEIDEKADRYAEEVIVTSMQRYASDFVADNTISVVSLPSDEMKGRIIGREGRNIKTFQKITGVDVIIDDTPEAITLSCFNPLRREVAKVALEKLVKDGRVHPTSIEAAVEKAENEVNKTIKSVGEKASLATGLVGITPEEIELLGKLNYRTSFGQNVLQHCLEVCELSGLLAAELGLDVQLAKRAGLFHDIGKASDFEMEGSHVELGVEIAERNNEDEVVINTIASHHGDTEPTSVIAVLVAAADALSAARPGARRESVETYMKRVQGLEDIANSFSGIEKSYAIQAGRELRVIVNPEQMSEEEMKLTAYEISKRIEEELNYPGHIKVNMIRETRFTSQAN